MGTVLDDESPAHNLHTYIEKLCKHAIAVFPVGPEPPDGRAEFRRVVHERTVVGHLDHEHQYQKHYQNGSYGYVRTAQHAQISCLDCLELGIAEQGSLAGTQRIELRLYEIHSHKHTQKRTYWIERLGKIETACSGRLVTHGEYVWVGTGLKEGKTAGEHEIGYQERIVTACHLGRQEHKGSHCIQTES